MRRLLTAAIALSLAVVLLGCTAEQPKPVPPSPSPVFATDAEALAAAEEALAEYWELNNALFQEGGANPERLKPIVTEDWYQEAVTAAEIFRDQGWRQLGEILFDSVSLKIREDSTVTVIVCNDYREFSIVGVDGAPVPSADSTRVPSDAEFTVLSDGTLKLNGYTRWQDESC